MNRAENECDDANFVGPVGRAEPGARVSDPLVPRWPDSRRKSPESRRNRDIGAIVGCFLCGRRELAVGLRCCRSCRQEWSPTPVGRVAFLLGLTHAQMAAASRVPLRTIRRAIAGIAVGPRNAAKLAKAFGLDADVLRAGTPVRPGLVRRPPKETTA